MHHYCPHCNKQAALALGWGAHNNAPEDGDFILCSGCGEWSIFMDSGLRAPTKNEQYRISQDVYAQSAWRVWNKIQLASRNK